MTKKDLMIHEHVHDVSTHEYDPNFEPSRVLVMPIDKSKASINTINFAMNNIVTKNDQVILLNARKTAADDLAFIVDEYGIPSSLYNGSDF